MKMLVDKKIRALFSGILLCVLVFAVFSVMFMSFIPEKAAFYIFICSLGMAAVMLLLCLWYFKNQHLVLQSAATQITAFTKGDHSARIECNEEGELNRFFHEVNTLAAILNAHAESEARTKGFLKDTIADISHQLKTPLAALNIYNGIMQEDAGDPATIRNFTGLVDQELERIETLVQNLLKITKLDSGTVVMEKEPERVSEMMDSIERHFAYRAGREEKNLLLSGEDNLILNCDRVWMIEAVSNLVKNAFDHTVKGNTIRIEWKQSGSMVRIIIRDNGSGIHPEDIYYIFKRFYRSRFSKDTGGIGLGLPLAKSIIEAHNGTIEVDSEPGAGSVFTLNFLTAADSNPTGL